MFKKWELVEENKSMIEKSFNFITEYSYSRSIIVDVYRKKKLNGTFKYKYVKRF